ncbi:MAG TPA: ABC transporter permease [Candidatus Paceibacterota bacterium]
MNEKKTKTSHNGLSDVSRAHAMSLSTTGWTKIIRPRKTLSWNDLQELWDYRELLYFFAWRDIKVKYKQTIVGIVWAVFQPIMAMVVFSVVFGKLANLPSDGIPYPIFVYSGLILWMFFTNSLSDASSTLVGNASIVTKVYFPRLLLPISASTTKLVDTFIASLVLIVLMLYYGYYPSLVGVAIVPLLFLIAFMASQGAGLILCSINVKYRDVRYVLPYFIQMLIFVTPVIYPTSIAGKYEWILKLNPMASVIESARAGLLGTAPIEWSSLLFSGLISLVLFVIGIIFFKKTERFFADVI